MDTYLSRLVVSFVILLYIERYIVEADCSYGDIRLVGTGSNSSAGTVEVCYNNTWGTVCDRYNWGLTAAQVACRQLGFNGTLSTAYGGAYFGEGTGAIVLGSLNCKGTEQSLFECGRSSSIGSTYCSTHANDAGVSCFIAQNDGCTTGDIRLVGTGSTISQGRVEVCYNNTWGTVCGDSYWDIQDAIVACTQLGFNGPTTAYSSGYFGQGVGAIILGGLACTGSETVLIECSRYSSIGATGCSHSQDAGVSCSTAQIPQCTTGDVRLVGTGSTTSQGRVEVCYNNTWGTVCGYGWNINAAVVVCKRLGYNGPPTLYTNAYFGQGTGSILFSDLQCTGIEASLFECSFSESIGYTVCGHSRDVGVSCSQLDGCANNGDVRLVGNGSTISQGRVEVCYNNTWGTVCNDSFGSTDASVVCKQLGYYGPSIAYGNALFGQGTGTVLLRGLTCTGLEASLLLCSRNYAIGLTGCSHSMDAGVNCSLSTACSTTGDIRLVGAGSSASQGRVEVCYNNQWGTVCSNLWTVNEAIVVCRQLGYYGMAYPYGGAYFGQGTGPILLGGVGCSGSESSLFECNRNRIIGSTQCSHTNDAGVNCSVDTMPACTTGALRLAGLGSNSSSGRVEMCYNGQWGTVCDYLWDTNEATIACKQLGYNGPSIPYTRAYFGQGTGLILLAGLTCSGTEASLLECSHYYSIGSVRCFHYWDAGVSCSTAPSINCTTGGVRLVGSGSTTMQGTVEVCYNNRWGTVCDYLWDSNEAAIVCRQLGFNGTSTAYSGAFFGPATEKILLSGLQCSGSEPTLLECARYYSIDATGCANTRDAGITCSIACTPGNIRLVGNLSSSTQGTVEVCVGGIWGTVCDDLWDLNEAIVVCNQLGYSGASVPYGNAYFGPSNETTLLSSLSCTGVQTSLLSCPRNTSFGTCSQSHDAGVSCSSVCTTGDIRLVGNGSTISQGRVEVCYNNTWGTVCGDSWDTNEAIVVCNQLGYYGGTAVAYRQAYFGQGVGTILLAGLGCDGTEPSLLLCPHTNAAVGITNCYHSQDAGVSCSQGCITGGIRLVGNGSTISQGRVEVCYNNTWGTVCGDLWGINEAIVVCKQLGYNGTSYAYTNGYFGMGTGPILLAGLGCSSSETSVLTCPHTNSIIGATGCYHSEDAGVSCTSVCSTGDIRLVGNGSTISQGRVEVCYNNTWGTVCGDSWGINEAIVVCKQLGYYGTSYAYTNGYFGMGTGPILLAGLGCSSSETSVLTCSHTNSIIGTTGCYHSEDAGVSCTSVCTTGDVRLVGAGSTISQGRVEVCYNNTWGTVCGYGWNINEAIVVCKQLGYYGASYAYTNGYFGMGTGPILFAGLGCTSSETSVLTCPHTNSIIGATGCYHSEDAGVSCTSVCSTGDIRLVGNGSTISQGRVEVCYNNTWGTVCGDSWGINEAIVVCKQLGYYGTSYAYTNGYFGMGTGPILLAGLGCSSSETSVLTCPHTNSIIGATGCYHSEDAGVSCTSVCTTGDIRLVGNGSTISQGRVEVCYNNTWGTVCGYGWDINEAIVVCNQLGYYGASYAYTNGYFGMGTGPILLAGLGCTSSETSVLTCPHTNSFIGATGCYHSEDAGVSCTSVCTTGDIRLVGNESTISQGRVEVCYNNTWGTVCGDSWGINEAIVVCKQLGYYGTSYAYTNGYFGMGTGPILLAGLGCTSSETSVLTCLHTNSIIGTTGCYHSEDAGVSCTSVCTTGDVRLVGNGSTISQGRVEVCYNNTWGTVCGDSWGINEAIVVCKQLGYYGTSYAYTNGYFGMGTGPILLAGLGCTSSETSVLTCPHTNSIIGATGCYHSEDAGVSCTSVCTTGDIRLVGNGSTISQGRVEVCYNNTWGTVCGDSWGINEAIVVCKQLGYYGTSYAYTNGYFGMGTGPILLAGLGCTSSETSVLTCPHTNSIIGATGCYHSEDAGVSCTSVCTTGDVRLVGNGSTISQGRMEVCYNNTWGTVCGYGWDINEAIVVCNQLGYYGASYAYTNGYFGMGTGPILLAGLGCTSSETSVLTCPHTNSIIGATGCYHSEDAGVSCTSVCTTGDIRLVGTGSTISQGRVEVCYNNTWGTVCGDSWGINEAIVVCKQLGYYGTASSCCNLSPLEGTGPIILSGLGCAGIESSLLSCPHNPAIGATNCSHIQDAVVVCSSVCSTGDVRLVGAGSTISQGRVEVCYNNTWGTVCGNSWDINEAIVVCNQLGYRGTATAYVRGEVNDTILLNGVSCTGVEMSLAACTYGIEIISSSSCFCQVAGVSCSSVCTTGDVRLVGNGSTTSQGRVEVCYNNTWWTVCGDSWGINEAIVVCNQIGYPGTPIVYSNASFGLGTGEILDLSCIGKEMSLTSCTLSFDMNKCSHGNDAGVRCSSLNCTTGVIRLAGNGSTISQGRVEVCYNNTWGTVCGDSWDINDATVVCKQLGYSGALQWYGSAYFGLGTGAIALRGVACKGTEPVLLSCPRSNTALVTTGCSHSQDVGVACSSGTPDLPIPTSSNSIGIAIGVSVSAFAVFVLIIIISATVYARRTIARSKSFPISGSATASHSKDIDMTVFSNEHTNTDIEEDCHNVKIEQSNTGNPVPDDTHKGCD